MKYFCLLGMFSVSVILSYGLALVSYSHRIEHDCNVNGITTTIFGGTIICSLTNGDDS
jgi:hypothetical protein